MAPTTEPGEAGFPIPPLAARLFALARAKGCEARIVGGAVRDWLAGLPIGDIDMAVAAPIGSFADACRAEGLRVVETGLSHGTVTVLDPANADRGGPDRGGPDRGGPVEVTQTRVDLETDGRHAVVGFSDDWKADASRRDFTINAIYIDADGRLDDPLGGVADLKAGILRFAGAAAQRVEEDALRMLRYCRFLPRFGSSGVDADAAAALGDAAPMAAHLSGERVAAECRRLFGMDDGAAGIRLMQETGIAAHALGLPLELAHLDHLAGRAGFEAGIDPQQAWLVRLSALTATGGAAVLARRLRLSRQDSRLLAALDAGVGNEFGNSVERAGPAGTAALLNGPDWARGAYALLRDRVPPSAALIVAAARCGSAVTPDRIALLASWTPPQFPLAAADLLSHGVDKGPRLGEMLRAAEAYWVAQDFVPSKEALIDFAMTPG